MAFMPLCVYHKCYHSIEELISSIHIYRLIRINSIEVLVRKLLCGVLWAFYMDFLGVLLYYPWLKCIVFSIIIIIIIIIFFLIERTIIITLITLMFVGLSNFAGLGTSLRMKVMIIVVMLMMSIIIYMILIIMMITLMLMLILKIFIYDNHDWLYWWFCHHHHHHYHNFYH